MKLKLIKEKSRWCMTPAHLGLKYDNMQLFFPALVDLKYAALPIY